MTAATQGERISMKLVQKPVPGSILVNGELAPTAEQKKALELLSKEHRIYVLGAQSAAYKSLLPEAVLLDGYVKKELYLQPAAWEFLCTRNENTNILSCSVLSLTF